MVKLKKAWWMELQESFCNLIRVVNTIAGLSLRQPSWDVQLHVMRCVRGRVIDVYAAAADQAGQAKDASASSQAEFQTLVTIWTELLTALVPQLERLGSRLSNPGISPVLVSGSTSTTSISTSEEEVFWELWNFLFFASDAYALARDLLPALWESKGPERFNTSLFAAYHRLLVWLSHTSQTSTAWRLMGTEHGLGERNASLVNILTNPAQDLLNVSCMIPPAVVHHLSSMPHNFVPLLCSIASGQIGRGDPSTNATMHSRANQGGNDIHISLRGPQRV